jgi:hypothetical protein
MNITDLQYENFKKICAECNEILFGTDEDIKEILQFALNRQGYWSGDRLRYYLSGDNWRVRIR